MLQYDRVTTEKVIRDALKADKTVANIIMNLKPNDRFNCTYVVMHDNIPVAYAKEILKVVIDENMCN